MRRYIIVISLLLFIYFFIPANTYEEEQNNDELVSVSYNDELFDITLDEYVLHVLACEMPVLFNDEALKANAIAIRTFYLYKKQNDQSYVALSTDQCYLSDEDLVERWDANYNTYISKLSNIVGSTSDLLLTYNGNIIIPFYYSLSNGYTENVKDVFGSDLPYLVSVASTWDQNVSSFKKVVSFNKKTFLDKLGLTADDIIISDVVRNSSNRVKSLLINGVLYSGIDIRKIFGLRSSDFDIYLDNGIVYVETKGNGHGVGMSQYGANEMAKLGYKFDEILKYYYKDIEIKKIDV